jgi:hypothetical protein
MNTIIVVLGVVLMILGGFAYLYVEVEEERYFGGLFERENIERPFERAALPLLIGGIILIVVGAVLPDSGTRTRTRTTHAV